MKKLPSIPKSLYKAKGFNDAMGQIDLGWKYLPCGCIEYCGVTFHGRDYCDKHWGELDD